MSSSSLKISAGIGAGTLILRVLVAGISLRVSQVQVRRAWQPFVEQPWLGDDFAHRCSTGEGCITVELL